MKKGEKQFLSGNERGILASGFVVISVFALALTNLGFSAHDYLFLVLVDGPYLLLAAAYTLLLASKKRSELLKRVMILVSFSVFGLFILSSWALFSFITTFTF